MRKLPILLTAAILTLATVPTFAADPAPAPAAAAPASLSPAIQNALKDFSSDDFKTRNAASAKLQLALADQLRTLTNSDDPEVLSRLADLLEFNDGLTRWIIDTLKLPPDQRKTQLDFGMQPDVLAPLALTYSADPDKRLEGVRTLAKIDKPEVAGILAPLLNDPDRAVYIAAMEAVWDKKPTDAVVDALWNRAIGDNVAPPKKTAAADANITFRGRPIGGAMFTGVSAFARRQDANIAVEVLINLKAPQVEKKLTAFLENYDKATDPANANANANANVNAGGNVAFARANVVIAGNGGNGIVIGGPGGMLYNPMAEPMRNVFTLIEAYKSKENLPILYKLATQSLRQKYQGNFNKESWYFSNRTTPLAAVVEITGQKPEDYNLKHQNILNNAWTFPTDADETTAIKKLHDWYAANIDKNVPDITEETPDEPQAQPPAPGIGQPGVAPVVGPIQPGGPIIRNHVNSRIIGPANEPGETPATKP